MGASVRIEIYERDDGWQRSIIYRDDGMIEFPLGIPLANPPRPDEPRVDYAKRVFRAHGYTLIETRIG